MSMHLLANDFDVLCLSDLTKKCYNVSRVKYTIYFWKFSQFSAFLKNYSRI